MPRAENRVELHKKIVAAAASFAAFGKLHKENRN